MQPVHVYALVITTLVLALLPVQGERLGEGLSHHRKLFLAPLASAILDRYIIVLNNRSSKALDNVRTILSRSGAQTDYEYDGDFTGFVVSGLVSKFLDLILRDDDVEFVEQDQVVNEDTMITGRQGDPRNWALDRIDQQSLPLDGQYEFAQTGKGVTIFILDSGINFGHEEFDDRAICGFSSIYGEDCEDERGHGSHVASVAAGKNYGVAKDADIVAVKVLGNDGTGSFSGVVAAVNFVAEQKRQNPDKPMIANMSLGGSRSNSINRAVNAAINDNVIVLCSGGNDGFDSCNKSPASVDAAITISATDENDEKPHYANYGRCVTIFAPGDSIIGAWKGSSTATNFQSGTSMATPVATGVAALYLERNPDLNTAQLKSLMLADATTGIVKDEGTDSPNKFLNTQALTDPNTVVADPVEDTATTTFTTPTAPGEFNLEEVLQCSVPSIFFQKCTDDDECCFDACRFGRCIPFYI